MTEPLLYELRQVRKVYQGPAEEVTVLSGLDFAIAKGCLWPFVMACLRRAAVVAAFVVAVSVGL